MKYLSQLLASLVVLGMMPLAPLWAQGKGIGPWRPVKDELGFFSAQAREQADQKVRAIKEEFNKDLFIETMKAPARPKNIDQNDEVARNKFFNQFAEQRFADLRENGVYILVIDNPRVLRIVVGNKTQSLGYFTEANRDSLFEVIKEGLKNDKKDEALLGAVNYVYDTMKTNHPVANRKGAVVAHQGNGAQPHSGGFNWSPILTIILVLVGVWVLFAVVRALFGMAGGGRGAGAPGMGAPGMGYGGGGGGGGFFSNFLGGMFGAAAGMWMYNSFFGHGGSSAFGAGPSDVGGGDKYAGADPADTYGTASGGDYGNDGGGGVGGGDAGGGDWGGGGGGDWGGGGGDFGGGGGDFGGGGGGGDW